jgi:hypothetical protein
VCEDCGITTENPEQHLDHLQQFHPNSPALKRSYDRRIIKINSGGSSNGNGHSSMNSSASNHDSNASGHEDEALAFETQAEEVVVAASEGCSRRKKSRKSCKEAIRVYRERGDACDVECGMGFVDEDGVVGGEGSVVAAGDEEREGYESFGEGEEEEEEEVAVAAVAADIDSDDKSAGQ